MAVLFKLAAQSVVSPKAARLMETVKKCLPASSKQGLKVEKKPVCVGKVILLMLP